MILFLDEVSKNYKRLELISVVSGILIFRNEDGTYTFKLADKSFLLLDKISSYNFLKSDEEYIYFLMKKNNGFLDEKNNKLVVKISKKPEYKKQLVPKYNLFGELEGEFEQISIGFDIYTQDSKIEYVVTFDAYDSSYTFSSCKVDYSRLSKEDRLEILRLFGPINYIIEQVKVLLSNLYDK